MYIKNCLLTRCLVLPLQKEKAVNDKKEDKKTKKAKENAEAEANEENHSENGDAKTNEVRGLRKTSVSLYWH